LPFQLIFCLMKNKRRIILDVPVDTYKPDEFVSKIEGALSSTGVETIIAVNPEKVMCARKDTRLLSALRETDFLIPDGIGIVAALKLLYGVTISRIPGIMLMEHLLSLADGKKYRIFIFGSSHEVNNKASSDILKSYPSLELVGTQHGYVSNEEYGEVVEKINSSGADILFVGLGSPKQEEWIHRYRDVLKVKICMGIGGSLDVIAGRVPRASRFFQRLGLEWLYRLMREPSRFKRQSVLPGFALEVLKEKICS